MSVDKSQVPHAIQAGACELFPAIREAVASLDLTSLSQSLDGGIHQGYRATIAAVSKNVPTGARPACSSTTSGLTNQTGFEAVLRRCADRYH